MCAREALSDGVSCYGSDIDGLLAAGVAGC